MNWFSQAQQQLGAVAWHTTKRFLSSLNYRKMNKHVSSTFTINKLWQQATLLKEKLFWMLYVYEIINFYVNFF